MSPDLHTCSEVERYLKDKRDENTRMLQQNSTSDLESKRREYNL